MNCAFEVENSIICPGPSHNILHPVSEFEAAQGSIPLVEGLPTLEEFCQNTPVVSNIYKLLETTSQDEGMLDFLNKLNPDFTSTPQSISPKLSDATSITDGFTGFEMDDKSIRLDFPIPNLKANFQQPNLPKGETCDTTSSSDSQTLNQQVAEEHGVHAQSVADTKLDERDENGNSTKGGVFGKVKETFTYTELTPAILPVVPLGHSAADVVENAITESNLTQPIGVTETEIDEAMQSVLDHIGQLRQKEFQETLDLDIVERCLEDTVNRPILICQSCFHVFDAIAPFQVHINTCCDPPRIELKSKMDQVAMDVLARGLWKQVFLKTLRNHPAAPDILKQEDQLHHELDQIWGMSAIESMVRCREMFIKAAVSIVTRKWAATAYANEVHRLRSRILKVPPKKRPKNEPDVEELTSSEGTLQLPTEKNGTDRNGVRRYPTRRRRRKPAKTETEIALDAILVDSGSDFAGTLQQQYHFTPETPVSEHGLDVLPASPVLSKRQSKGFHTLENSIEMEIEFEPEIERIVREDDAVNDEVVAAAAKNFEGLDEKGNWENGQIEETPELDEGEYVVREILHRRLIDKNIGRLPMEDDFEYLVAWDGFGDEENTWEPYEHLKHCVDKLKVFHDRLKVKAMRKRKAKRM